MNEEAPGSDQPIRFQDESLIFQDYNPLPFAPLALLANLIPLPLPPRLSD